MAVSLVTSLSISICCNVMSKLTLQFWMGSKCNVYYINHIVLMKKKFGTALLSNMVILPAEVAFSYLNMEDLIIASFVIMWLMLVHAMLTTPRFLIAVSIITLEKG